MNGDSGELGAATPAFDRIGAAYGESHADNPAQVAALEDLVARLPSGGTVLDLGCGTGRPAAGLVTAAGHGYVGVDESGVMLDLARATQPEGARFVHADLRDTRAWPRDATGVVAHFSLLMLPRDGIADVLAALTERLPAGAVLSLAMVELDGDAVPVDFLGEPVAVSGYPQDALRAVVTAAGFTVEQVVRHTQVVGDHTETQLFVTASAPASGRHTG